MMVSRAHTGTDYSALQFGVDAMGEMGFHIMESHRQLIGFDI
jgi:hypothetical protein